MVDLWRRVPVIVRAVIAGLLVLLAGNRPWDICLGLNLATTPAIPWSVVPAALWLWIFWRWLGGRGWPRSTAQARRTSLRAARLPARTWGLALLALFLGLACVEALNLVARRLVAMPRPDLSEIAQLPAPLLVALIAMTSLTAGVVEEAAFRGYMQRPIERRHGPVVAILVVGFVFALAHFSHGWMGWQLVPVYMLGSAVYGTLAYATGSILPGLVWHTLGDVLGISLLVTVLRDAKPRPLIWESGADAAFWIEVAVAASCAAAAMPLFVKLLRARPQAPPTATAPAAA